MSDIRTEQSMSRIEQAQAEYYEFMRKKHALKAAKEAARKEFWKEYNEQLAKSVPNQGGAHHGKNHHTRAWRIW